MSTAGTWFEKGRGVAQSLGFFIAAGLLLFGLQSKAASRVTAQAMASDDAGNIYLAGFFLGELGFNGAPLSTDRWNVFIAKHDAAGQAVWSRGIFRTTSGELRTASVIQLAANMDGTISVVGQFSTTHDFSGAVLKPSDTGSFLARYNAAGELLSVRNLPCAANSVSINRKGEMLVAASESETFTEGLIASRLDPNAEITFQERVTRQSTRMYASAACFDRDGNTFVAGAFSGVAEFEATDSATLFSRGMDIFLTKRGPDGSLKWVAKAGGAPGNFLEETPLRLATDTSGNCFILAKISGQDSSPGQLTSFGSVFLTNTVLPGLAAAKFGPDGQALWVRHLGEAVSRYNEYSVAADGEGSFYVSGLMDGRAFPQNGVETNDFKLIKLSATGEPLGAESVNVWTGEPPVLAAQEISSHAMMAAKFQTHPLFGTVLLAGSDGLFVARMDAPTLLPLNLVRSGRIITLLWPPNIPGLRLESSATLGSEAAWSAVQANTAIGRHSIQTEGSSRFFRLFRQ